MQAKMILELMSIDRERAILLVKCWEQLVNAGASGAKDREFLALDDYIPWRIVNVGEPYALLDPDHLYITLTWL